MQHEQLNLPDDKASRAQMGCGAAAAVTAQAVCYPLDTIRRRMQMNGAFGDAPHYNGVLHCVKQVRLFARSFHSHPQVGLVASTLLHLVKCRLG